ncbi:MAG: thiol peroxidase [Planctomycetes bacterium]|nr:thiol peroxidase [Planctomycetota bacterium]
MIERKGAVTFKGSPLTLLGPELKCGQAAPDAVLLANDLSEFRLSGLRGKKVVVSTVPSLDTPVCDIETRTFNQKAAAMGGDVTILAVSMDLPFAQARWCGAADVKSVRTLSDHREAALGLACGLLIKELRLLARCVFLIDPAGTVRYVQLVKEISSEPDYEAVCQALARI